LPDAVHAVLAATALVRLAILKMIVTYMLPKNRRQLELFA
jgi:hypothetical protein